VTHLLEELQLTELADAKPASLSGGERQRVAFARALAVEPKLLLLDEPFASLDQQSRDRIRALLAEVLTRHKTPAVLITHDRQEALALGDRVVRFERGKTVASGAPDEVLLDDGIILEGTITADDSNGNKPSSRLSDVVLHGATEHLKPDQDGRFRIRLPISQPEE
jgi:molybdate transport system ATP-binding protein